MKSEMDIIINTLSPSASILEIGHHFLPDTSKFRHHTVIQERWEEALPSLGIFDVIFYHEKKESPLLDQAESLLSSIHLQFPQLKTLRYSDQELENFYQQVGHLHLEDMGRFLCELKENRQISNEQYDAFVAKYQLKQAEPVMVKMIDPIVAFFEACYEKHMRKGSQLICFSKNAISRYENSHFFEQVITNPHFDYEEIPSSEGLIIKIIKL